jgi:polyisoprenoid-binding protein YceI
MMRRALVIGAAMTLTAGSASAGETEFKLDPAHTSVGFSVQHMGLSRVRGEFRKFDAKVAGDPASGRISQIEATVDAGSIDTGIEARDNHLRAPDFFETSRFAQARLVSKKVTWKGDDFTALVDLTLRDVTRPVTFTGQLLGKRELDLGQGLHQRVGYVASARIKRSEFGLSFGKVVEGVSVVGDEVTIEIQMQIWRPLEAPDAKAKAAR